jgi:hypothetical protein
MKDLLIQKKEVSQQCFILIANKNDIFQGENPQKTIGDRIPDQVKL